MLNYLKKLTGFKKIQIIVLLTMILLSAGYFVKYNIQQNVWREKIDFNAFYYGTKCYFAGINPYIHMNILRYKLKIDPEIKDLAEDFPLLPYMLYVLKPITYFPLRIAQLIWLILSNICFLISLLLICKMLFAEFDDKEKYFYVLLFLFVSVHYYGPTVWENALGNLNNFVLFFLVSCYYYIRNNKQIKSGIFLGLAIAVKIIPIVIIPYFILKKRFIPVVIAFVLVVFLIISSYFISRDTHIYKLWYQDAAVNVYNSNPRPFNQSIKGMYHRIFSKHSFLKLEHKTINKLTSITLILIFIYFIYFSIRINNLTISHDLIFSIMILFMIFFHTRTWETWYIYLIPVFILHFKNIIRYYNKIEIKMIFFTFIISYILVAVDFPYKKHAYMYGYKTLFSNLKLYGAILLSISIALLGNKVNKLKDEKY